MAIVQTIGFCRLVSIVERGGHCKELVIVERWPLFREVAIAVVQTWLLSKDGPCKEVIVIGILTVDHLLSF